MKTKSKITYQDNDPASFMEALLQGNPSGGSITLDQVCERVPGAERREVIKALKESDEGVFVVGRKGHASRWVYGPAAEEEAEKFSTRQAVRRIPTKSTRQAAQVQTFEPRHIQLGAGRTFTDLSLQVTVAGQKAIIPLKVELIPAEVEGG